MQGLINDLVCSDLAAKKSRRAVIQDLTDAEDAYPVKKHKSARPELRLDDAAGSASGASGAGDLSLKPSRAAPISNSPSARAAIARATNSLSQTVLDTLSAGKSSKGKSKRPENEDSDSDSGLDFVENKRPKSGKHPNSTASECDGGGSSAKGSSSAATTKKNVGSDNEPEHLDSRDAHHLTANTTIKSHLKTPATEPSSHKDTVPKSKCHVSFDRNISSASSSSTATAASKRVVISSESDDSDDSAVDCT